MQRDARLKGRDTDTRITQAHPHLRDISREISEVHDDANILLLVGRDAPPFRKIHESCNGPRNAPWAQRLDLGWVIIGNACLDGDHKPTPSCYRTNILESGRPTMFLSCLYRFHLKDNPPVSSDLPFDNGKDHKKEAFEECNFYNGIKTNVFLSMKVENKPRR